LFSDENSFTNDGQKILGTRITGFVTYPHWLWQVDHQWLSLNNQFLIKKPVQEKKMFKTS
jgi:hypothetical protein